MLNAHKIKNTYPGIFCCVCFLLLILQTESVYAEREEAVRQLAEVYLTDGTVFTGTVELTPRHEFYYWIIPDDEKTLQPGNKKVRKFNFDVIREMTFEQYSGGRRKCNVTFNDGVKLGGVLKSTVFYMRVKSSTAPGEMPSVKKFILKSQMREKHLVTRIKILDKGRQILSQTPLELCDLKLAPDDRVMAITEQTLTPLKLEREEQSSRHIVKSTLGENVYVAVKVGGTYMVGWPEGSDVRNDLFKEVEIHVNKLADYYNERTLIGVVANDTGSVVHSLLKLRRQVDENAAVASGGQFDSNGAIENVRVSVWTWRRDPETGEMALIKRGSFCRDRVSPGDETPHVEISDKLWPVRTIENKIMVGTPSYKGAE